MLTCGRPNARLPRGGYVWPDVHYPTVLFGFTDDVLFRLIPSPAKEFSEPYVACGNQW